MNLLLVIVIFSSVYYFLVSFICFRQMFSYQSNYKIGRYYSMLCFWFTRAILLKTSHRPP